MTCLFNSRTFLFKESASETSKSCAIFFMKKQKTGTELNNQNVPFKKSVRYLGVTLDRGLTFRVHVNEKFKAAKFKLLKVRNVIGKFSGPSPAQICWIYTIDSLRVLGVGKDNLTQVFAKDCSCAYGSNLGNLLSFQAWESLSLGLIYYEPNFQGQAFVL